MDGRWPPGKHRDFRFEGDSLCFPSGSTALARLAILLPLVLALLFPSVQGNGQPSEKRDDAVGLTLICNTTEQLTRFIDLVNLGREAVDALRAVNEEAENPTACGNAVVAFEVGKTVAQAKLLGEMVNIVEIRVFALSDGSEWTQVSPTPQYTIRRDPGETL